MKKLLLLIITLTLFILSGCVSNKEIPSDINYRQSMRDFVQGISEYSKEINPNFIIIPQNGHQLITEDGESTGAPVMEYINAIDGIGREDLFYGYEEDNLATPENEKEDMLAFMDIAENHGIEVLVTDYCHTQSFVDDSYTQSAERNYISFAADTRDLYSVPQYPLTPYNMNSSNITLLSEVNNFLYIINPSGFTSKNAFLSSIQNTDYDLIIIDLFDLDGFSLTASDIESLKVKANGGTRLVIAYMSIGEAEEYRYYWDNSFNRSSPSWLEEENKDWAGNYKVRYWDENWQSIIYGNNDSYLKMILDVGFDGVYLDIIDGFEYFENL